MCNEHISTIFDILKEAVLFNLYNECMRLIKGVAFFSKSQWKEMICRRAWDLEKEDWSVRQVLFNSTSNIQLIGASDLKCNNQKLCGEGWTVRSCELCNLFEAEDPKHLILRCPLLNDLHSEIYNAIRETCQGFGEQLLANTADLYAMLLGKHNHCYPDGLN